MKVHARKLRNSEAEGSGNEGSSENSTSDTDNEGTEEEEEGSWRNGGEGKEVKKVTKRKDENPKKGRREKVVDRDKIDNKSPKKSKRKKGVDSDLDDDEDGDGEERLDEHNRDTFFKAFFDEMIERIKKDSGGPMVVNDVDFSNMDIGPYELEIFVAAILEHFKVVGKPCFVHYMNFSACRLCGFDYKTNAPPTGESDESSKSKAPSTILSQKSDPHDDYSQWDHRGFKKFMKLLKYARYSMISSFFFCLISKISSYRMEQYL